MTPLELLNHIVAGMAEGRAHALQLTAAQLAAKDAELVALRAELAVAHAHLSDVLEERAVMAAQLAKLSRSAGAA